MIFYCCFKISKILQKRLKKNSKGFGSLGTQLQKAIIFSTVFLNSRKGLLQLYNKCLTDSSIPSEWKTAEITMLPKKAMIKQT
jgi:hypothetical protein